MSDFRARSIQPAKRDIDLPRRTPDVRTACGEAPQGWVGPTVLCAVTCRTPGCRRVDDRLEVPVATNADGIYRVLCGGCNEWIEDISELGVIAAEAP